MGDDGDIADVVFFDYGEVSRYDPSGFTNFA
jgi:hypothetical protein